MQSIRPSRRMTGLTAGSKYVIDSSAWIEYLFGTNAGKKAAEFIENPDNTIITPNIVLAEVASKYARLGENPEQAIISITEMSSPAAETRNLYAQGGIKHAEMRRQHKNISLADCIVLSLAEMEGAAIIAKDYHLKGRGFIDIGK